MAGVSHADALSRPVPVEVLRWPEFQAMFLEGHNQGEHVSIVGPTGSGKTRLGLELCKLIGSVPAVVPGSNIKRPSRVTVLCYKPRDDTLREVLPEKDWPILKTYPPPYGQEHGIVWVRKGGTTQQRNVFVPLLNRMYDDGSQTVYVPEAAHFERKLPDGLGLGGKMTEIWTAARSNKLTMVSDTQRPRWVTRSMWTEPQWVVIFAPDDEDDLGHVAKMSGRKVDVFRAVANLGEHEFVCIRRQRGTGGKRALYVSRVDV